MVYRSKVEKQNGRDRRKIVKIFQLYFCNKIYFVCYTALHINLKKYQLQV